VGSPSAPTAHVDTSVSRFGGNVGIGAQADEYGVSARLTRSFPRWKSGAVRAQATRTATEQAPLAQHRRTSSPDPPADDALERNDERTACDVKETVADGASLFRGPAREKSAPGCAPGMTRV
jgi:hypothetical protein